MKIVKTMFAVFTAAFAIGAFADEVAEFNPTNYPAYNTINTEWLEYKELHKSEKDEYSLLRTFWKAKDDATRTNYLESLVSMAQDGFANKVQLTVGQRHGFSIEFLHAYDTRLASLGVGVYPNFFYDFKSNRYYEFPKCTDNRIAKMTPTESNSWAVAIAIYPQSLTQENGMFTFPQIINVMAEQMAAGRGVGFPKTLKNEAMSTVRHYLRDKGETFFTDGDVNPLQIAMDAFNAAINAPKFAGLKEWVATYCPNYQWVEIQCWKTNEEINELKEKVFYGDVEFTSKVKLILQSHLGTEAYNEFIRRYNGETAQN